MAAVCTSLALPAVAQDFWQFSYTGFFIKETERFEPGISFGGDFRGSDANRDGILELGELATFSWNGYSYFENPYTGCNGAYCSLKAFSYDLGNGQLTFDAEWRYSDEAAYSTTTTIAGKSLTFYGETGFPPTNGSTTTYLWTDQTRFAISPPPVDEPPFAALLPAGLLLMGVLRRRRA